MIKGVVFDIDDTLYLEQDYVKSGFTEVSRYIGDNTGIYQHEIFSYLWELFLDGVRSNTFNHLLNDYPALKSQFGIPELVEVYRSHLPKITLLPDIRLLLVSLRQSGYRLGVVSDGFLQSQQAKVRALGLETLVDTIQLTDKWGKDFWKPHPRAYERCAEELKLSHSELCYIADNTVKDFIAPNELGWLTIKINIPGQQYSSLKVGSLSQRPDYSIRSYNEVLSIISRKTP
jgi:putative hydrolase of the HAD superfamily